MFGFVCFQERKQKGELSKRELFYGGGGDATRCEASANRFLFRFSLCRSLVYSCVCTFVCVCASPSTGEKRGKGACVGVCVGDGDRKRVVAAVVVLSLV